MWPRDTPGARRWPVWLAAGACVLVAGVLIVLPFLPIVDRGKVGNGMVFFLTTPAEALALFGFGGALARIGHRRAALAWLLFLAGAVGGAWAKDAVLSALVQRPGGFELTGFVGPFLCLLSGAVLMLGDGARRVAAPALAPFAGAAAGFAVALNDPTLGDVRYIAGAVLAIVWLLLAPGLLLQRLADGSARIAAQILASWLLAIGLLLGVAASAW